MSHLLRGLSAALNADQFVVAPERAVEEKNVDAVEFRQQLIGDPRNCRQEGKPLFRGSFNDQSERGFSGIQLGESFCRNVSGEVSRKRKCAASQRSLGMSRFKQREPFGQRDRTPGKLSFDALQHGEHRVVFDDLANRVGCEDVQRLQFPHQQQSEDVVNVSVQQDCAGNWRMSRAVVAGMRMKVGTRFDLRTQIGRGSEEKPVFRVSADRKLSLASCFAAKGSGS